MLLFLHQVICGPDKICHTFVPPFASDMIWFLAAILSRSLTSELSIPSEVSAGQKVMCMLLNGARDSVGLPNYCSSGVVSWNEILFFFLEHDDI